MVPGAGDPPAPPADPTPPPPEAPPRWDGTFAVVAAIVLLLVGAVALGQTASAFWDISKDNLLDQKTGRTALAAAVSLPLLLIGALAVAIGAWMALVEWRGRFAASRPKQVRGVNAEAVDVPALVKAIGELKGAALVMVVGAALMISAAWVAQSSVEPAATPAAPTATTPG